MLAAITDYLISEGFRADFMNSYSLGEDYIIIDQDNPRCGNLIVEYGDDGWIVVRHPGIGTFGSKDVSVLLADPNCLVNLVGTIRKVMDDVRKYY